MATFTTRLGLRKPAGGDQVDVQADLNANFDLIDTAAGCTVVTSGARPATPFLGQLIHETDTLLDLVWDGANWVMVSIPSSAVDSGGNPVVDGVYDGLLVYAPAVGAIMKYEAGAWSQCIAVGGAALHEARWTKAAGQTISTSVDTLIAYDSAIYTAPDTVLQAVDHLSVTLQRTGLWMFEAGVRFAAGGSGERHLFLTTGNVANAVASRFAGTTSQTGLACSLSCGTEIRLTAGTIVAAGVWQASGASLGLDLGSGQTNHFTATWLRP